MIATDNKTRNAYNWAIAAMISTMIRLRVLDQGARPSDALAEADGSGSPSEAVGSRSSAYVAALPALVVMGCGREMRGLMNGPRGCTQVCR